MKILHVASWLTPNAGGPITFICDVAEAMHRLGVEVEVLGLSAETVITIPGVPIHGFRFIGSGNWCHSVGAYSWAKCNVDRFDIVVIHGMWQHLQTRIPSLCRARGIPYVCVPHGMWGPWPIEGQGSVKRLKKLMFWKIFARNVFLGAAQVMFTTDREQTLALAMFPKLRIRSSVLPYSVKAPSFEPLPVKSSAAQEPYALFLGRVHPKKNVELLLRAWAAAGELWPWKLVIAGPCDAAYATVLSRLIETLEIRNSVRFIGMVTGQDKIRLLSGASWFVLPSFQENFAIAALEAIQVKCPVVLSTEVYLGDSLKEPREVLGLDICEWSKFFKERMRSREHREMILASNVSSAIQAFDFDVLVNRWKELLSSAAASSSRPGTGAD